jgi:hypothetical protein
MLQKLTLDQIYHTILEALKFYNYEAILSSKSVWSFLGDKCNFSWHDKSWDYTLHRTGTDFKGKSLLCLLAKLMFAAAIY